MTSSVKIINIEEYKCVFQDIIKMNNDILDVKKMINNKLFNLKQTYNNLIKNNYKKIYIFCLDSFYFQYKILSFEIENTTKFITLIGNRMYGDYYKLYNIILLYCKEKNIELNIEINKSKFQTYRDLEPFYEYNINEIHNLFLEIIKIMDELYNNYLNVENKINDYKNNNNGLSISNLINTLECENTILREQIILYLNYISFFQDIQKDYFMKLIIKVNNFNKEIDEYLISNEIETSLKQYNLYINKDRSSSKDSGYSSKSISPVNSLHSSTNSLVSHVDSRVSLRGLNGDSTSPTNSIRSSPNHSRFHSPLHSSFTCMNPSTTNNSTLSHIHSRFPSSKNSSPNISPNKKNILLFTRRSGNDIHTEDIFSTVCRRGEVEDEASTLNFGVFDAKVSSCSEVESTKKPNRICDSTSPRNSIISDFANKEDSKKKNNMNSIYFINPMKKK